jgi:acyl-CoA thioesterase
VTEQPDSFDDATAIRPLGDGTFMAGLHADWAVGSHPHGGYLLAILTRAAVQSVSARAGVVGQESQPLSVSAEFLRGPKVGPVLIRTERLKTGRTITVVRATLEQSGKPCVTATVGVGRIPTEDPVWSSLPEMPVNPPPDAIDLSAAGYAKYAPMSQVSDLRLDQENAEFLSGGTGEPRLRLWVKPRGTQPDLLFSLFTADVGMPVTFNLGRFDWAPTVQLTALLRARPANGWLRLLIQSTVVRGRWLDEDALVVDSTGHLVCQSRQLVLSD